MDEFVQAQAQQRKPGTSGWWELVIPELDAEQRESLMEAARSRNITHRTISVVLNRWGFDVNTAKVAHWRRTHVR